MLKFFSEIDFSDSRRCLCLFNRYVNHGVKIFGDVVGDRVSNYTDIMTLKRFCVDNGGVMHFYVFSDADKEYVESMIKEIYAVYCKHDARKVRVLRKNMRVTLYKGGFDDGSMFTQIKNNMRRCGVDSYDNIILKPQTKCEKALESFAECRSLLSPDGRITLFCVASWLINLRGTSSTLTRNSDMVKDMVRGHVKSVVIENLNVDMCDHDVVPSSIVSVDYSRKHKDIDFTLFGERKTVKDIDDCNLIGRRRDVMALMDKIMSYKDMSCSHITSTDLGDGYYYCPYKDKMSWGVFGCESVDTNKGMVYKHDARWVDNDKSWLGQYIKGYYQPMCNAFDDTVTNNFERCSVYGTLGDIENWRYFVLNNKLPLFISIVVTYTSISNIFKYVPWIVSDKYSDKEIYGMLGLTRKEIRLIETTLRKFKRHSPWYKRYICGKDSVPTEVVQNFVDKVYDTARRKGVAKHNLF